jgi:sulfur-oxidizing protein SoxY
VRRRDVLLAAGLAAALPLRSALADGERLRLLLAGLLGERAPREGRVVIDIPEVAENGATVPIEVTVASPMTEADHVRELHLLAERNPSPEVAVYRFTPRSGRAFVATRIRLAESQRVHALAIMSDGTPFAASREVQVTVNGCGG